jgi:hypothetical protein
VTELSQILARSNSIEQLEAEMQARDAEVQRIRREMGRIHDVWQKRWKQRTDAAIAQAPRHLTQIVGDVKVNLG